MARDSAEQPELWPIFICYRRIDGFEAARRLHEVLDKCTTEGPDGRRIQLDVYLDETVPGVEDWRAVHQPYLERARAILVVCTPGARINEGEDDWVHREIDWWLEHRRVAPILVDPLKEGIRYVPEQIAERWPEIQRIALVAEEWIGLGPEESSEKVAALRRQVIGAILPSGAKIYADELEAERRRARTLGAALVVSVLLLGVALLLWTWAQRQRDRARLNQRVAEASSLEALAAEEFAESRRHDNQAESDAALHGDLRRRLQSTLDEAETPARAIREANLRSEIAELDRDIERSRTLARKSRVAGARHLEQADAWWASLPPKQRPARPAPEPPRILTVELIGAGRGESLLIHYGQPDDPRLVLINAGPKKSFRQSVRPKLEELQRARFEGRPLPIELMVVSDKDDHKTGGLASLLGELAEGRTSPALADIREIWANIFQIDGGGLRATIRQRIAALAIPFNRSSRQVIARPDRGRGSVTLRDGLEVIVVGPDLETVTKLYDKAKEDALRYQRTIEEPRLESPSWLAVVADAGPLPRPVGELQEAVGDCVPSRNAEDRVQRFPADTSAYREASSVNLASLVLLFRYRQRTFLFTGDGRGDLILEGLEAAGLLDENGGIHVDLLSVPHQGSSHNITVDFFERVTADHYLFSGDGTHENPSLSTVAALIHARGCDPYRMYFTDRDGVEEEHGAKLDAFFAAEREYRPSYRRFFRASSRNSLMVHLLDPVRY